MKFCKTYNLKKQILPLALCIIFPLLVGAAAGFAVGNEAESYKSLILPAFAPPPYIFPVVWTVLYTLMGISSYIVLKAKSWLKPRALTLYIIQLAVNFIWPFLFFSQELYLLSFIWILLLLILVLFMTGMFWQIDKKAAILQIPYILWLLFAAYLNLGIYILNR